MTAQRSPYQFHLLEAGTNQKPAILFLHGFLGSAEDWQEIIAQLASDFHCLAIDLPGHGNTVVSGGEESYRMEHVAKGIADYLQELGITRCFLVGYSMGGRLALYLALHYPEAFQKALLESASPGLKTEAERTARKAHDESIAQEILQTDFSLFLHRWYNLPLFKTLKTHPHFDRVLERRKNNCPEGLAYSLRQTGTGVQPSLWEKLAGAKIPLRLVVGEHDHKFVDIGKEMASLCKTAELSIIPDAGHT
ncbi:MAG: 2-succinyl-6-hydroxy-2,4-cyclohexadiene-1-carboxylate synthase, partial [Desulfobulbaceae bacterium]|nr:2-succinyl-6-hydroxy-2,4-cyclohexadiene-1-carboxylate synthase [Desulfobulbaceae bacterium]